MNVLLYLPGILSVLIRSLGPIETSLHLFTIVTIQMWIGMPFLLSSPRTYVSNAFDLSRQFLYKWTVNWRFVPEQQFLSASFSRLLLGCHLLVLLAFAWKWFQRDGGLVSVVIRAIQNPWRRTGLDLPSGDEIITILLTSNLIGITFARSLHYQFYSWYAHHLPLLTFRTRYPAPVKLLILASIEYAWNVFPSTSLSSEVLLASHVMLLVGIWSGWPCGVPAKRKVAFKEVQEQSEASEEMVSAQEEEE